MRRRHGLCAVAQTPQAGTATPPRGIRPVRNVRNPISLLAQQCCKATVAFLHLRRNGSTQEEIMTRNARFQDFHFRFQDFHLGSVQLPAVQREGLSTALLDGPVVTTPYPIELGDFHGTGGADVWWGTAASETAYGNGGDDALHGMAGDDRLYGGDGNDTLYGSWGKDRLEGGNGNDTLSGGDDQDQLYGQGGDDLMYGDGATDFMRGGDGNDRMSGGSGDDEMYGDAGNDTMVGGTGNDVLVGGNGNDMLLGGAGSDTLEGGAGSDTLEGGAGADMLFGEAGNDVMNGGDGNDTLIGGAGFDRMTGGAGADRFVFEAAADSASQGIWDVVIDFQRGTDKIDLSVIDADATDGGWLNDSFSFIGSGAFTGDPSHSWNLSPGELRYQHVNGWTYVMGDVTGDGEADITIALQGTHALTASDFIL
jgi:Ca2+-binding RTX toxin-like protein